MATKYNSILNNFKESAQPTCQMGMCSIDASHTKIVRLYKLNESIDMDQKHG